MKRTDKIQIALRSAAFCGHRVLSGLLLAAALTALAGATGCTKEPAGEPAPGDRTEIVPTVTLPGGISVQEAGRQTRGAVNPSSDTDLWFVRADETTAGGGYGAYDMTALKATRAAGTGAQALTFDLAQYYPLQSRKTKMVGWHPTAAIDAGAVSWTIDGTQDVLTTSTLQEGSSQAAMPGFTFEHRLAQLQFCPYAEDADATAAWGKVTAITVTKQRSTCTFTPSSAETTGEVVFTGNADQRFAVTGITNAALPVGAASAVRSGDPVMIEPQGAAYTLKITLTTELGGTLTVSVPARAYAAGTSTRVLLRLSHRSVAASAEIAEWATPTDQEMDWNADFPWLVYGDAAITTGLSGSTKESYNAYTEASNGSKYTDAADAYVGEKPYVKLQIALKDEITGGSSWLAAYNACKNSTADGGGWRLPRMSEMKLIANNLASLEARAGFSPFSRAATNSYSGYYWCATESATDGAWRIKIESGEMMSLTKTDTKSVRCVREIPLPPVAVGNYVYADGSFSAVLESGSTPVGVIFWVNPDDENNFKAVSLDETMQQWSSETVITGATGTTNGAGNMTIIKGIADWHTKYPAFAWCADKTEGGNGWYLPARDEFQYLYCASVDTEPVTWTDNDGPAFDQANRNTWDARFTASGVGGTKFTNTIYWSATEESSFQDKAWIISFTDGYTDWDGKDYNYMVRCVREYPLPPPPAVGDYYYSDGTCSTALVSGKTPAGIVFWVNPDDDKNFKVVSLDEVEGKEWSTEDVTTGATGTANGAENMAVIKAIPDWHDKYPAFAWCADKTEGGSGWYLPANDELQYLYCASVATAPVTWPERTLGPAVVQANRDAWNARFTASGISGCAGFANIGYRSATEDSSSVLGEHAYTVAFLDGVLYSDFKHSIDFRVRCIREIK